MDGRVKVVQVPQPGDVGFLGGISSVKINGVEVPPRLIVEHSGPAELVLEGENLTPDTLKLYHNGVLYTPLESNDTYAYYLLGDNGTNKIMLNGKNYSTIIVKDIIVPEELPTRLSMRQKSDTSVTGESSTSTNYENLSSANCINYPYTVIEDYPYYLFFPHISDTSESDWGFSNCAMNNFSTSDTMTRINVSVTDPSKPAYITYQGFIIAVFNYTN